MIFVCVCVCLKTGHGAFLLNFLYFFSFYLFNNNNNIGMNKWLVTQHEDQTRKPFEITRHLQLKLVPITIKISRYVQMLYRPNRKSILNRVRLYLVPEST